MDRKTFVELLTGGITAMKTLKDFGNFTREIKSQNSKMPVLFVGHGSPMNGIESNEFSDYWVELGKKIPRPEAVVCISAHWLTHGTFVTAMQHPKTIHDFGGFPKKLYEVNYSAPGNPSLAGDISELVKTTSVLIDHEWGLDHGCWTVVRRMYPDADIPVIQLSIDFYKPAVYHYKLAKELSVLRNKGILILGSGNMVHNLRMIDWQNMNAVNYGFDWAQEINETFKSKIRCNDHKALIDYQNLGNAAKLAIPTPDHYFPLIYALGLQDKNDCVEFFNDKYVAGSLSMTSVRFES
jgi:4,5-DOPA dioxygenase extradiol